MEVGWSKAISWYRTTIPYLACAGLGNYYRAIMRLLSSVRLSVCLSVTIRYHDHIGWNSSKIISRPAAGHARRKRHNGITGNS